MWNLMELHKENKEVNYNTKETRNKEAMKYKQHETNTLKKSNY